MQPKFINQVLEEVQKKEQRRINAESFAISNYAASKIRNKHGKAIYTPEDFLPYKLDDQKVKDPKESVSSRTAKVMKRLIESGILPTRVEAAAKARIHV